MSKVQVELGENLRVEGRYEGKTSSWITDVSKEFGGIQEYGSPVDMLMGSLAACIVSVMGITAKKIGLGIQGTRVEVEYKYAPDHTIEKINIIVRCPKQLDDAVTIQLEKACLKCPVHRSLSSHIEKTHHFYWGDK